MRLRLRPVDIVLMGWAAAWLVLMAWHGGLAWHFFVQGGEALARPGQGLHLYAAAPVLQIGPLAFVVVDLLTTVDGHPRLLAAQAIGVLAGGYVAWQIRRLAGGRHRAWPALVCFVPLWTYLAVASAHLDDVLALTCAVAALAAARAARPVLTGVLLGLAVDAKPWALGFAALLMLLPGVRARMVAATWAAGVVAAGWLPFFLADPETVRVLHFTIVNSPLSALRALGVTDPRTPPWDRPLQTVLGVALGILAVRRGRWPALLLLAVAARVALDPGTNKYYAAGIAVGALLWDLAGSARKWPLWSIGGLLAMYVSRWLPIPPWAHGDITLAYCAACALGLAVAPSGVISRDVVRSPI